MEPTYTTKGRLDMQQLSPKNIILTVMIEGSSGDNNYSAYIPELRLGVVGDTVEEARANVLDLAMLEIKKPAIKVSLPPIIETVHLEA